MSIVVANNSNRKIFQDKLSTDDTAVAHPMLQARNMFLNLFKVNKIRAIPFKGPVLAGLC
jgi:hypothetical protein